MRLDTKQLYFVFILIALKINASLVNETNELSSLGREVHFSSLDKSSPNIGFTTYGGGGVRLVDGKFPEVFLNGIWSPICGHWFWDNDFGANLFCQELTSNPASTGKVIRRTDKPLEKDAIRIGRCLSNDQWLSCSGYCNDRLTGQGCRSADNCFANSPASIEIKCSQGDKCARIPSWMKSDLASFDRIVNGKTAPSPIPWQVHLRQGSPTDFFSFCGGTIIDAKTILTAAHCYSAKNLKQTNFFITAGIVDRFDGAGQSAFVEKIILHESWTFTSNNNDIAILKLKTPLAFNNKVQQACLPDASFVPTGKAVASGWGFTVPSAEETLTPPPQDLQWVAMPVVTNDKCVQAPFKWDVARITANMICAGDADGGEDTCKGDSGGPLVIPKSSTDDTAVVIGITSFGSFKCGKQGFPGVFTYVTKYINWIKPKMES